MGAVKKHKVELVTADEAIRLINEYWHRKDGDKNVIEKQTIYNKVNKGELQRYGPRHILMLDKDEVMARFCS